MTLESTIKSIEEQIQELEHKRLECSYDNDRSGYCKYDGLVKYNQQICSWLKELKELKGE